jgi:hypothetical protein
VNKFVSISAIFTILCLINFPCLSNSAPIDQEISKAYTASEYGTAIRLLEQLIEEQRERLSKGEKVEFQKLYKQYLLLAHIYAWRLNKPDVALLKYQELTEWKKLYPPPSKFPTFELLYIAEIYEARKDWVKAREYYQYLLNELADFSEKENDDVSILMSEELIKFVKYQIDGLQLKTRTEKGRKPLLTRLKLSSQLTHPITPFLVLVFVPGAEYLFSQDKPVDLVSKIQQSPSDLSSMILNYAFILAASASTVDEASEKAMEAYLKKYPESYYSLKLRYLFYKFYKESGQNKKAEKLAKELEKIGRKREIELILEPDKRFSSPEKTWETYRNALIAGDIDLTLECYVPGQWQHKKVFTLLGNEKVKELGREMGEIKKIAAGENRAKYMIKRKQKGTEITYWIYFQNIDGEWKIQEF